VVEVLQRVEVLTHFLLDFAAFKIVHAVFGIKVDGHAVEMHCSLQLVALGRPQLPLVLPYVAQLLTQLTQQLAVWMRALLLQT